MIFAKLEDVKKYGLGERFEKAFEFLCSVDGEALECGRHEIEGDALYANVALGVTRTEGQFEAHERYADVQYVVRGREVMEFADIKCGKATKEYDAAGDYALYGDMPNASRAVVSAGELVIFFPEDLHKPSMAYGEPSEVKKIIVKVKL